MVSINISYKYFGYKHFTYKIDQKIITQAFKVIMY